MSSKVIEPALGLASFSCPHCSAISHQTWYRLLIKGFEKDEKPMIWSVPDEKKMDLAGLGDEERRILGAFVDRLKKNLLTYQVHRYAVDSGQEMVNLYLSRCYSCNGFSVWLQDKVIYPVHDASIVAHEDMPAQVKTDFNEAATIVNNSPRGAAALLRLCIQKLMKEVGQKGKKIDDDIADLVRQGLDARVQKALDVVRVIGNNAVHPGQIDLQDDKATAMRLFDLVNVIVQALISTPKQIDELYAGLPETALAAIEKRDGTSDKDSK